MGAALSTSVKKGGYHRINSAPCMMNHRNA